MDKSSIPFMSKMHNHISTAYNVYLSSNDIV